MVRGLDRTRCARRSTCAPRCSPDRTAQPPVGFRVGTVVGEGAVGMEAGRVGCNGAGAGSRVQVRVSVPMRMRTWSCTGTGNRKEQASRDAAAKAPGCIPRCVSIFDDPLCQPSGSGGTISPRRSIRAIRSSPPRSRVTAPRTPPPPTPPRQQLSGWRVGACPGPPSRPKPRPQPRWVGKAGHLNRHPRHRSVGWSGFVAAV